MSVGQVPQGLVLHRLLAERDIDLAKPLDDVEETGQQLGLVLRRDRRLEQLPQGRGVLLQPHAGLRYGRETTEKKREKN